MQLIKESFILAPSQLPRDSKAVIAFRQPLHGNNTDSQRTLPLSVWLLEVIANKVAWIQVAEGKIQILMNREIAWPEP